MRSVDSTKLNLKCILSSVLHTLSHLTCTIALWVGVSIFILWRRRLRLREIFMTCPSPRSQKVAELWLRIHFSDECIIIFSSCQSFSTWSSFRSRSSDATCCWIPGWGSAGEQCRMKHLGKFFWRTWEFKDEFGEARRREEDTRGNRVFKAVEVGMNALGTSGGVVDYGLTEAESAFWGGGSLVCLSA